LYIAAVARAWPLTGRLEELKFVAACLRRAGRPRGIVLAGAAGVGKSLLAREALCAAERNGSVTRWAAATESAREVPFGAFAGLLGAAPPNPADGLHSAIEAMAGTGRAGALVVVDDAHLLDDLSAVLVQQLVLQRSASVVLTLRSGERAPDAITSLWKDQHLDRLELQPLSETETTCLLEGVLGAAVAGGTAHRIWALTQGNALFLRHVVDAETQAHRLRESGGVWQWSGEPTVSSELTELVEARMGQLPGPIGHVLDLLALGEPLPVTALERLASCSAVEQAETRCLLAVERDGRRLQARLAHPLYGEVRRAGLGTLRARRLRGQVATALAAPTERQVDSLRRAVLTLDSDLRPNPDLFAPAARVAAQLLDLPLAERLARAAVAAGGGFQARFTLGSVLGFQNRPGEAQLELQELRDSARTDLERGLIAVSLAGNLFWTQQRPTQAIDVLAQAATTVSDETSRWLLAGMKGALHFASGRTNLGLAMAIEALACGALPPMGVTVASMALLGGLGVTGRADQLGPAATRGYRSASETKEASFISFGLASYHIIGLRLAGYIHEIETVSRQRSQHTGDRLSGSLGYDVAVNAHAAFARGRIQTSIRLLREARSSLADLDTTGHYYVCMLNLTQALALIGDVAAAREALGELDANEHSAFVFLRPQVVLARAWVAAAEGSVSRAIRTAHEAAAVARSLDQPAHEVLALHTAACFGDRTVAERLTALATRVDGPRAPAAAAQAVALAGGDGNGLVAASVSLEAMGDLLSAADAAAQAADAYRDQSRTGSAAVAAARAHRLAETCQGAHTPALVAAAQPLPLTSREREIATLAAAGHSNRAIATRLVISVRTVEGHLYNASSKVGASNRAALATILSDR
jgi:DNA-binding NarL/FixJ family response regulator